MNKILMWGAIWSLAIALFVWGAVQQGHRVNTNRDASDQSAYLGYARHLAESNFAAVGDRSRMPVYPALMAFLYGPQLTEEEFFQRAKLAGIALAGIVIAISAALFRGCGTMWDSTAATLVVMLTVLAYKAPYCQADVLFYGLNTVLFCLCLKLLDNPRWTTAVLAGVVGGLAHLTKASVLPAIGLVMTLLLIRSCVTWYRRRRVEHPATGRSAASLLGRDLACLGLLVGCFLLVIFPYIRTSQLRFGHPFYNVNSTFYFWYDSWDEAKAGTRAHGDRVGWPDMPPDQIPSLKKYVREHSLQQAVMRVMRGLVWYALLVGFYSYGYGQFGLLYLALLGALFWQNRNRFDLRLAWTQHGTVITFVAIYFCGYLLLYAWFAPVAIGHRFALTLFLPAMWLFVRGLSHAQEHGWQLRLWRGSTLDASAVSPLILLLVAVYAVTIYPQRISTMYGGS